MLKVLEKGVKAGTDLCFTKSTLLLYIEIRWLPWGKDGKHQLRDSSGFLLKEKALPREKGEIPFQIRLLTAWEQDLGKAMPAQHPHTGHVATWKQPPLGGSADLGMKGHILAPHLWPLCLL